ncbi:MAG: ABC transporter ATP-binding protein [Acidobacteriia bacterium]|nr:ABC transporter ATP-binding protein [Terriglobia bacterium]
MTAILESVDLKRHYPMGRSVVRALDGVSFTIQEGEFVGLLGTSGSGKSTLLNLIAGLDRPTSGALKIFDQQLDQMSREALSQHRRKNVGMIFQSFNLIATMTAFENVTLAMMFSGVPRAERERRGLELFESVGLQDRQLHRPAELSGGEQQRVAIARALANSPAILLADEPTGNLDSTTAREILEILKLLNEREGKTILWVTHDTELASKYIQRSIRLKDGRIADDGISPALPSGGSA